MGWASHSPYNRGMNRRRFLGSAVLLAAGPILSIHNADDAPDLARLPVIYARHEPASVDAVSLVLVGDCSFARGTANQIAAKGGDFDYPLREVASLLRSADLAVGNLECVIASESAEARPGSLRLRADPEAAGALRRAGFGLLSLANNHTFDYGADGLRQTADALQAVGLNMVGAGPNHDEARLPSFTWIKNVKIGWLSYTQIPDPPEDVTEREGWGRAWLEEAHFEAEIAAARAHCDVLIVQCHWGQEYWVTPYPTQVRLAGLAARTGASLVIGHHPHVSQPTIIIDGTPICYSLGNFLFDQFGRSGFGVWVRLDKTGIVDVHRLDLTPGTHPVWKLP